MGTISDGKLDFVFGDPKNWPVLRVSQANQLNLENADFNLENNRSIIFAGNAKTSALGDMSFLTGDTYPTERMKIFVNGNIGIGTGATEPTNKLEVVGSIKATDTITAQKFVGEIAGLNDKLSKTGGTITDSLAIQNNLTVSGSLKLQGDLTVNKFSSDGTLNGNSDSTISTEKAVKTYIDTKVAGIRSSQWSESDGNLVYNINTSNVGIGTSQPSAKLEVAGNLKLQTGVAVNQFSSDTNLGNSDQAVPTQKAVKTYVDSKLTGGTSQWSNGTGGSISYTNGNVGIGTTNPSAGLEVQRTVGDWLFLKQQRSTQGGGGFHIHNPWKDSDGDDRNRLEIAYKTPQGQDKWGQFVIHGPTGNVGIGTTEPQNKLHVKSNSGQSAAVLIENTSEVNSVALLLRLGQDNIAQGSGDRFITFAAGPTTLGYFMSRDRKTITFEANSSDFAECLPRLQEKEAIEPGDIVGVLGARVTKRTANAHHVMVITDRPIVLGNAPVQKSEHLYEKVSFLGQVPIKVRGRVSEGDCIVPSGLNDGTGIAISRDEMSLSSCSQIVGTAWESSEEEDIKLINTAIGLHSSYSPVEALMRAMQEQQAEIEMLKTELRQLREQQERQFLKA